MGIAVQHASTDAVFRALSDATRRAVFERLTAQGEANVADLTAFAGVSQPAVSQHLKALREAGLVSERRAGRNAFYKAEPRNLSPLVDWVARQDAFWRAAFGRLSELVKEIE
jgi:DNA-binding transcriptional ArsR family regulator